VNPPKKVVVVETDITKNGAFLGGGTPSHPSRLGRRGVQRAAQRPGAAAELPFRRGAAGDDAHGAAVAVAWKTDGGSGP